MTGKESDNLKQAVIAAVSKGSGLTEEQRGETSFSSLLANFVNLDCTEETAALHWKSIIERRDTLSGILRRPVSVYTAVADYCAEPGGPLSSPFMVEGKVYRDTVRQAMVDGLTGIFNRRYMDLNLRKEYNRCERWGKSLSLCMIDIDDFKKINDTKGHQFGDKVLIRMASILQNTVRNEDVLCRYGGEEFLVVLPETDETGAAALSNRLFTAVRQDPFLAMNRVTFSAGLATYPGIKTAEGLLAAADRALYQAKYNGKNRAVTAAPERRQFGRYPYTWEVSIIDERTQERLAGITTLNVSLGGVQFACPAPYHVDTPLHLVFRNQETGVNEIVTDSTISWVKKLRESYLYGVRFEESPNPLRARLENCAELSSERA